jgi:lycopene beta-cyclase
VLPFGSRRLLIEDTAFSPSPVLDLAARRDAVLAYALRFGRAREVVREERGVLPMPWSAEAATAASGSALRGAPLSALRSPLVAGYQGGFFHPATGYSFPVALRLACLLARLGPTRALGPELAAFARAHEAQARFARQLNRLLFTGFAPEAMHHVFERFYTLPAELINRFYALQLSGLDRARILVGRPPRGFSLARAIAPSSVNP